MNKPKRFSLVSTSVVVILLFLSNWVAPVQADIENIPTPLISATPITQADTPEIVDAKVPDEIKNTIQAYFEIRYRLLSVSPPADVQQDVFGELVSSGDEAKDFIATETAKLAVERKWYEMNNLRYAKYEYSLNYQDVMIDIATQTAVISLYEKFEIVCERTVENNPKNPASCADGALSHEITLRNPLCL